MQPTNFEFVFLFLPFTVLSYWSVIAKFGTRAARALLLVYSIVFISAFNPSTVPLFLILIVVNFWIGERLMNLSSLLQPSKRKRRMLFGLGTVMSLGILFYFKYFVSSINWLSSLVGGQILLSAKVLPLGISFFTFVQVIHLWNCYNGINLQPRIRLTEYIQVLTFFPHLVAGPIVMPSELVPQLRDSSKSRFDGNQLALGLFLISIGLFKKLVIADGLAENVKVVFDDGVEDGLRTWIGTISYTFQLYFDFSGYVDIARGVSAMFGLYLMHNFDSPLKAMSISDFWSRWHMTLTRIANQYVFTPIALNLKRHSIKRDSASTQVSTLRLTAPILVTFLLLGIWHGAGFQFLVFGLWHGIGVTVHSVWKRTKLRVPGAIGFLMTFLFVIIGFVFFRSSNLNEAFQILDVMFGWKTIVLRDFGFFVVNLSGDSEELIRLGMVLVAALVSFSFPNSREIELKFKTNMWFLLWSLMALFGAMFFMSRQLPFLYWQF